MVVEAVLNSCFIFSMYNEMFYVKKIEFEEVIFCLEWVEKVVIVSKFIVDGIVKLFLGYEYKLKFVYVGVDFKYF